MWTRDLFLLYREPSQIFKVPEEVKSFYLSVYCNESQLPRPQKINGAPRPETQAEKRHLRCPGDEKHQGQDWNPRKRIGHELKLRFIFIFEKALMTP